MAMKAFVATDCFVQSCIIASQVTRVLWTFCNLSLTRTVVKIRYCFSRICSLESDKEVRILRNHSRSIQLLQVQPRMA